MNLDIVYVDQFECKRGREREFEIIPEVAEPIERFVPAIEEDIQPSDRDPKWWATRGIAAEAQKVMKA